MAFSRRLVLNSEVSLYIMKITKELKYATFEWDEETKSFMITEEDGNRVILNKVYAFAFMRFVVRMAQRNWLRNQKKPNKRNQDATQTIEEREIYDPNQLTFCEYEVGES
ncbi:MAG: hypothetical protein CMO74_14015 [Verrucomicrobiales bacterium]|nr:hypothetical protein [Verrucomicrobiales bacterium]|tara:strand:+ start:51435 stop:51764 length:330 start_codon:yes stop_codon:yes gene_type:complete